MGETRTSDTPPQIPLSFWQKLAPADIIALIVIVGGVYLVSCNKGEDFGPLLIMVVSFYFGLKTPDFSK